MSAVLQKATVSNEAATVEASKYFFGERSAALSTIMRLWYLKVMAGRLNVPTPRDKPEYRTHVDRAWRVLLVGNGPTHGWGVYTHGLALTGQLGASLTYYRQSQPVDVDYVGDEMMNAATLVPWLGERDITQYDLVVVVLSMNDAARLTPMSSWQDSVDEILSGIRERKNPNANLLVVGIQPVASVEGYNNVFGAIAQRQADRLNSQMKASVEASGDYFMELSAPQSNKISVGDSSLYKDWASEMASNAASLLPAGLPPEHSSYEEKTWGWAGMDKAMEYDGGSGGDPLREIAEEARRRFKMDVAYVSIVDDGTQYFPTGKGPMASSVPLNLSYCNYVVQNDETLIVPNGKKDERFKDNPYIDLTHMQFYAGTPLKSQHGSTVGTFCVMSAFPKSEKSFPREEFEEFAKRAQNELWKIENSASGEG